MITSGDDDTPQRAQSDPATTRKGDHMREPRMQYAIEYVVRRTDGSRVRLPREAFGAFEGDWYALWGLYSAIAAWAEGAPLRDLAFFLPDGDETSYGLMLTVLDQLVLSGHVTCTYGTTPRYHAVGVEVIA